MKTAEVVRSAGLGLSRCARRRVPRSPARAERRALPSPETIPPRFILLLPAGCLVLSSLPDPA